jgi:hypothetical protein
MKKVNLFFVALALISFSVLMNSCKKEDTTQPTDTSVAEDDSFAEAIFDDVSIMADEAYDLKTSGIRSENDNIVFGGCVTITLDTLVMPRVLTIDFGEENCLCLDGKYRRGKIIVTFNGRYKHPGTVITHGFEEYYVNDHNVDGTKVVTNMGPNDEGHIYYTIEVLGVIHLANDGGTISWNSSRQREWIQGFNTGNRWDDIYHLTGIANGIRVNGLTWEAEIMNPLRVELACRFIVSGTVELRPENRPVRSLDYGNGECDNIATVTINGEVYTIYLRR